MKRMLTMAACSAAAVLLFAVPLKADNTVYVTDNADLLTDLEEQQLNEYAYSVAETYNCGVYVRTEATYSGFSSISAYAENVYKSENLGYGTGKDGIMFIITMDEREYDIVAYGDVANAAFTDYGKTIIANNSVGSLSGGNYYGAFSGFIQESEYQLDQYINQGTPIDTWIPDPEPEPADPVKQTQTRAGIAGAISALFSGLVCSGLKRKNKTAQIATTAGNYIRRDGFHLTRSTDMMIGRNVSRIPIQQHNDRPSGGGHYGGTSINNSGFSHKSGKF